MIFPGLNYFSRDIVVGPAAGRIDLSYRSKSLMQSTYIICTKQPIMSLAKLPPLNAQRFVAVRRATGIRRPPSYPSRHRCTRHATTRTIWPCSHIRIRWP